MSEFNKARVGVCTRRAVGGKLVQVSVKVGWHGPGWQSVSGSRSAETTGMLRCRENELKAR